MQESTIAGMLRQNCLSCVAAGPKTTRVICHSSGCALYRVMRRQFRAEEQELLKAARAYCLDCMGEMRTLVRHCSQESCIMYTIRDRVAQEEVYGIGCEIA